MENGLIKCRSCSYSFDPTKEGNSRKRKCGMCCFGDTYSCRAPKKYDEDILMTVIISNLKV